MTEHTNTPALRFSEFTEEWEENTLSKLTQLLKDGTHGTHKDVENGAWLLSAKNIKNNSIIFDESDRKISYDDYYKIYKNYQLQKDDLLLSIVGTIGRTALVKNPTDLAFQRSVAVIRFKNQLSSSFFLYLFQTYTFKKKLLRNQVVSAQPGLYLGDLGKFFINHPNNKEQVKIGNFFSKLDRQIELEEEKLELLEQQKKGYMQKIFSQELRLKDENGNLSPEWTQTQLKNITNRITRKNKKLESTRPLTISGQLGLIDQVEYFNKSVSSKNLENYTLLQKNEFAYNKSYSNGYPLGAIKRLTRYDKGVLSSLYICFSISSDISVDFMQYYFESTKWFREVASIAVEGARNHGLLNISVNDFFDISIKLPSLENQKKISSFLIKIDNLIEKQSSKVELLKQRKQGLLQKMFI
ncbi:restriction endonuclease subunit S [Staphylococcus hominis]|uniref:restriction endonuclease subunit S n=1 Tax=Staphylococcus hominis TaxID=1290 RepID=UPI00066CCE64